MRARTLGESVVVRARPACDVVGQTREDAQAGRLHHKSHLIDNAAASGKVFKNE